MYFITILHFHCFFFYKGICRNMKEILFSFPIWLDF